MNDMVLAIENSFDEARRFCKQRIGCLGSPYREPLQLAVDLRQGIYPDQASNLNFITVSDAQFLDILSTEARTLAVLSDTAVLKPIAYMDLQEFHGFAVQLLGPNGIPMDYAEDHGLVFELAEQIAPQFWLI